jgi:alkaline phosphatase D
VLEAIQKAIVTNVVWITADVHYTAAHHYDPSRAATHDFDDFWEFVAGPIHAGTFGPNPLDPTFGPEQKFVWAPTAEAPAFSPLDGLQSYGLVEAKEDELSVGLWGAIDGHKKFEWGIPALWPVGRGAPYFPRD